MTAVERPKPTEDPYAVAERRRAARALLREPLLPGDGATAEDFRLIRRHRTELARMFADGLGYRLVVDPGAARLFKPGLGRDPSRPLTRGSGAPFTPRAYAMLCLTLAALTQARQQLLVGLRTPSTTTGRQRCATTMACTCSVARQATLPGALA